MQTNNIVSTPNITGNIGSCKSEKVEAISGRTNLWTQDKVSIITNSCTGQITTYNSWEITATPYALLIIGLLFLCVLIGVWVSNDSY